ncbi:hypothetical protein FR483_n796R [Paramecium bursaria Chlorella virus FR483]|uniref:Uncharacterized protein n796R n=1 Tax=Paramecium bursaria Chlorella virus FR483 TaxID=399781 RepID=A7J8F0_PBCVF|nr:hypothetical protein FR483_n796R [Paramecium bursaria Chlorella virus FR483]ABT16081.1 hypothetical protein FR483_n796R [Paramecium bursaria Chlorella virus FR483]
MKAGFVAANCLPRLLMSALKPDSAHFRNAVMYNEHASCTAHATSIAWTIPEFQNESRVSGIFTSFPRAAYHCLFAFGSFRTSPAAFIMPLFLRESAIFFEFSREIEAI